MEANRDETTPSWEGSSCLQPRHPLHLPNPLYKELIQIKNVKARIRKKEFSKTKEGQGVNGAEASSASVHPGKKGKAQILLKGSNQYRYRPLKL